jgi:hypothetical protein
MPMSQFLAQMRQNDDLDLGGSDDEPFSHDNFIDAPIQDDYFDDFEEDEPDFSKMNFSDKQQIKQKKEIDIRKGITIDKTF